MPNDGAGKSAGSIPDAGNLLLSRLRHAKRSAVEEAVGKAESWATKVINGESGVMLTDLPALLTAVGLKLVDAGSMVVDPTIAKAFEAIVAKATAGRSLLTGDE